MVRFAESNERLLEETVLLLHRAEADLSDDQRELLTAVRRNDVTLAGKKVLVVDDDVRNIFALTSVLEQHNLQVVHAENGRAGIETLLKTPGVDGVLMDIMMPEMDGYETMRAIRQIAEFRTLPIIAVTAKAMKGDRAKCIEAGASDYITKPVDLEQLFSVLRVWLVRSHEPSPVTPDGRPIRSVCKWPPTQHKPLRNSGERRIKILLVDDTPENLVSLEAALSGLGEELVLANSGKEALRYLLEDDFAAILLDVRMPEMDGFETAELIRSRPRSRQTPILFLTGYRNEEHLFRGYDLGAVDFLFKPIVPEVLRSKVAVFVELSRSNAKLQEQADALRTQAEVLQKAEQKFRSLLEAAPDAMVVCREDGEIVMVNSQTEILFNCQRDKLISRNIRALVPGWEYRFRPGWDDEFRNIRRFNPSSGASSCGPSLKAASPFQAEFSFSPLQTEEGVVVTCSIRDISERKKTEERIRELNTNLEERVLERTEALMRSNEELQQFAYVASHDLQEPLRTVSIYAQLLAKRYQGQLAGDADQFIKFIVEGSERMEKLIHDLLDFSRVDARGTDFFTRMNCDEALNDAIRNLHSLIEESGAVLTREPLPWVTGDPVQLTRLFQNLLVNSIKYRTEEAPRIHISAHEPTWRVALPVRDNGIGIEPQYAEKVFGIFKCLQPRDKSSGSGMGLAICRKIVSRHEGRIWVESALGEGATFYFTLPRTE